MAKSTKLNVKGTEILVYIQQSEEYISLTDIARYRDAERSDYLLQNWMRNRSTIEFMGLWEIFNNPNFNSIEFDGIKVGIIKYFPKPHKFNGTSVSHPVLQ